MKAVIEGLLFVSGEEGLTIKEIENLTKEKQETILNEIENLKNECSKKDRGIDLVLLGNKYKFTTKAEHKEYYQKLVENEINSNLSDSAIETLAIIAYNSPITRLEIDNIRGVNSSFVLRKLMLKNLITIVGKSEIAGRPNLYTVTNKFLDYFGLANLDELPKINIEQNEDINSEKDLFKSKYTENDN